MNRHINFHGKVRRYNHNLSYRNFFSGEIGELRPVWLEDAVPGDTFQYHPELRCYFAPLVFPVLTSMKARVDVFFIPQRILWNEWESFITGGPDNTLDPAYPSVRNVLAASGNTQAALESWLTRQFAYRNSLLNNLGHPYITPGDLGTAIENDPYDLTPLYAYLRIWDDYYRDEEKEDSITAPDGVQLDIFEFFNKSARISALASLLSNERLPSIAWAKDYFTTASLEQQRGGDIPLLSNPMFVAPGPGSFGGNSLLVESTVDPDLSSIPLNVFTTNEDDETVPVSSALTINGLRYLYSAANWLNNNVVGGTRYIEILRRRYRVVSSDARLQRPEMIGSIKLPVNIDVVTQTSSTVEDDDTVQALGDRAGKASIIGAGQTLTYSAEEFGWYIAVLHVAPKASYFQGIRFNLQREDKFDFWTPEFEHVPQRPIRNNEIFFDAQTASPEDGGTFGYTGQYNEYRFHNDEVHGDFQDSLLAWTMARKFSALPSLASPSFLRVDHDTKGNNRIFAVPDSDYAHIFGVVNNIVVAKREISNREPHF